MARRLVILPILMLGLDGLAAGATEESRIAPLRGRGLPPVNVNGQLGEWQERPVAFELPGDGRYRRSARIWLGTWERGLVVAGRVVADHARFAASAETLRAGDHVVVRLAVAHDLSLPPIGYGSQHGEVTYESETDCPDALDRSFPAGAESFGHHCRSWLAGQRAHRERLRRLFVRRWLLAPGTRASDPGPALEDAASPAFAGLDLASQRDFELLRPRGVPRMAVWAAREGAGYDFEIEIPWEAMPPAAALRLDALHLAVEVHRGHAESEPSEIALPAQAPAAWTRFVLAEPRLHRVGACEAPLRALDPYGRWQPGWFVPGRERRVERTFLLGNPVSGYRDVPYGRSPVVHETRFFDVALADGSHVCGPGLSLHRGGERVALHPEAESDPMGLTIPHALEARREGAYTWVKIGPFLTTASRFGTGQCGACPRVVLRMLALDEDGRVKSHFRYDTVVDFSHLADVDLHVDDDWRSIESYEARREGRDGQRLWQRNRYCRAAGGASFEICAQDELAAPPHRVLTPLEH